MSWSTATSLPPATAKQYLAIDSQTDWESKVFGRETGFHGFYINNDFPTNEAGAARPKVTDTKLLDGDVLDYFVGSDTENQNDYYTWLEVPATMTSGEDITVTVKGVKAMDPDATQANAQPLEGVGLAWVDMATGTVKPIEGVVTDENGKATFTVVEGAATGRLVAITATYHTHTTYALMNPSAPIQMVTGNVHITYTVVQLWSLLDFPKLDTLLVLHHHHQDRKRTDPNYDI